MRRFFGIIIFFVFFLQIIPKNVNAVQFPYNCGWANESENKCCWPSGVTTDQIAGGANSGGLISSVIITPALTLAKGLIFDWGNVLLGYVNLALPSPNNAISKDFLCRTGEPVNKDDPSQPFSSVTENNCQCQGLTSKTTNLGKNCLSMTNASEKNSCIACLNNFSTTGKATVWTALGCVPLDLPTFISQYVFVTLLGLAGLLSLGCLIYWAFKLETGGASADVQKKAREGIRQCFMGLLLIIFSIFIIRLIGVSILSLPGIN